MRTLLSDAPSRIAKLWYFTVLSLMFSIQFCSFQEKRLRKSALRNQSSGPAYIPVVNQQASNNKVETEPFHWEGLNTINKSPCGAHKCLFSTISHDDEGYLVVQDGPARTRSMQQAYDMGKFLEKSFGIKHVFLEAPKVKNISKDSAARLNSNLYYPEESTEVDDMFEEGKITMQKVRIVSPDSSLLFGCTSEKKHLFWDHLHDFLDKSVHDKTLFAKNVIRNLQISSDIVDKVRCLGYDFQVFVDSTGEFYHFDLDRCFMRSEEDEEKFMHRFYKRTRQLRQTMNEILSESSSET